jgi:spore coat protein U-like protein
LVLGLAGFVIAANEHATVDVSGLVVGTCKFNSGGTVSFNLDPSVGGVATGTVTQPAFWCTRGSIYTITDDKGLNETGSVFRMLHTTTANEYIPYTFTYTTTGTGKGKSTAITMDIASTVAETNYINALVGSYADTVTLTINP